MTTSTAPTRGAQLVLWQCCAKLIVCAAQSDLDHLLAALTACT